MLARMELRQLRHFVAVAETGSISKAAKRVFLTQPALSRQIKALEEEIGQCLLERRAHSIHLTPVGERFLEDARALLRQADEVLARVRFGDPGVRLRVGYAPSLARGFLSAAVARFSQTHANARVELLDLSTVEMLTGLADGRLDVVVTVRDTRPRDDLAWIPLVQADWRLATSAGHPLANRNRVKVKEIAAEPLLVFCQQDYPEYREMVTAWFRESGLHAKIAGEYDGTESLISAVESGLGLAIVTTRVARHFPGRVVLKRLANPPEPLCIAAAFRKSKATELPLTAFVKELRRAADDAD